MTTTTTEDRRRMGWWGEGGDDRGSMTAMTACMYSCVRSGFLVALVFCFEFKNKYPLLETCLNSLMVTHQPVSYALFLILPFFVFPLCARTRSVRELFHNLHRLSGTVSFSKLGHQTHIFVKSLKSHLFKLARARLCACVRACACCRELVLTAFWFFGSQWPMFSKFGEIAHKRTHYYSYPTNPFRRSATCCGRVINAHQVQLKRLWRIYLNGFDPDKSMHDPKCRCFLTTHLCYIAACATTATSQRTPYSMSRTALLGHL